MSRERVDYSELRDVQATGLNPDEPVSGYYRMRLKMGGAFVGVRIWYGAPLDPETGDEMDRSWRWQALVNDGPVLLERVWPKCGSDPVDQSEYEYLCEVHKWAKRHAPNSPQANPMQRINPLTAPTPF
ncbi:hypothetical protein PX699_13500 [Sphingobium sp. H39-3-25]|uniref:hypothetical protein n=1 Tax=Sphingobium arseniciresistens TaxID=3030834 RepID=UPI0023B97609|nr:hypothetical protein [Sphingobium arseniciresistens]